MTTSVGIIDYQAGNVRSLLNAFESLGVDVCMVAVPDELTAKTHLVLPGVGAFGYCAEKLAESGMLDSLNHWVLVDKKPLLGICVGMQLLADFSEEHGMHQGLGWIGGQVLGLQPEYPDVRVPHVGWNTVEFQAEFGRFRAGDRADFYFDHSFAYRNTPSGVELAYCMHGIPFTAIVRKGNLLAAQFHPEKSQDAGKKFLKGFLDVAQC